VIVLMGGPPRVGKSTLAGMLLERDGLPYCPTDALVSMLQQAAPALGVRHGEHDNKAALARPFVVEFLRAVADGIDPDDPDDSYVVEGDVVTPEAVTAAGALGLALAAVFLGNTALTPDDLRHELHWLEGADDSVLEDTAAWIRSRSAALRADCSDRHLYVDVGVHGYPEGLERAYRLLRHRRSGRR
jgi:hypothetical protein